jgi:hypothetical protein
VSRIKASLSYTTAIGNDLGIIAPESTIDISALQPILKVKLEAGKPRIKCSKGVADALDLFVDRHDGNGFILLGRLIKLDFIDTASLPSGVTLAEWSYRAIYVIGNDNVGMLSAEASVVKKA